MGEEEKRNHCIPYKLDGQELTHLCGFMGTRCRHFCPECKNGKIYPDVDGGEKYIRGCPIEAAQHDANQDIFDALLCSGQIMNYSGGEV